MPALKERLKTQFYRSPTPDLGKIITPPESLWQSNHELEPKDPLEYLKGDFLLPKGAKAFYKELGLLKKRKWILSRVTPDNFMWLLGIATPRVEIQPDKPWHYNESVEINYPEKETKIKKQVQEMIFRQYEKDETKLVAIRVVEFDEKYHEVSSGRKYKLEITSLIVAHVDQRNREIFELPFALPAGTEKEDIFSLFDDAARVQIEGEDVLIVPSLEDSPQFQYGIKIYEGLLDKAEKGEANVDIKQARGGLEIINARNDKGNIRPGETKDRIINGHICTRDWNGEWVPKFMLFDDLEGCKKWLEFDELMVNGPDGDYEYEGGTISAATSNKDPNKKINEKIKSHFRKKGNVIIMTVQEPPNWNPINVYHEIKSPEITPSPRLIDPYNPFILRGHYNPLVEIPAFWHFDPMLAHVFPTNRQDDNSRFSWVFPQANYSAESRNTITPLFLFPAIEAGQLYFERNNAEKPNHYHDIYYDSGLADSHVKGGLAVKGDRDELAAEGGRNEKEITDKKEAIKGEIILVDFTAGKVLNREVRIIPRSIFDQPPNLPKPDGGGERADHDSVETQYIASLQKQNGSIKAVKQQEDTSLSDNHEKNDPKAETLGLNSYQKEADIVRANISSPLQRNEGGETETQSRPAVETQCTASLQNDENRQTNTFERADLQGNAERRDAPWRVSTSDSSRFGQTTPDISRTISQQITLDTFDGAKLCPLGQSKKAPLSINPEHTPAFKPESRRIDFSIWQPAIGEIVDLTSHQLTAIQRVLKDLQMSSNLLQMGFAKAASSTESQFIFPSDEVKEYLQQTMGVINSPQVYSLIGFIFIVLLNLLSGNITIT